jgi:hypothetical protein
MVPKRDFYHHGAINTFVVELYNTFMNGAMWCQMLAIVIVGVSGLCVVAMWVT